MSSRLKVAFVAESVDPERDDEVRANELIRRLRNDFELHVFTMTPVATPKKRVVDGVVYHSICRRFEIYRGGRRSVLQAIVFALGCFRLIHQRFDVITAEQMPILHLFPLKLVCMLHQIRLVVSWSEVSGGRYWRSWVGPRGFLAYAVEGSAMRLGDTLMAETKWTADRLLSLLGPYADVRTAVNGADPVAAALTPVVEPYVDIVAVASLVGHERIDLILETVARLQRIYAPVTLRVISSQPWPEYAELRRRSERLGIADQVEFAARPRGSKELYEQVKAARVFVSTSERDGSAASPLLALACGLPSITTSAPNNLAQYLVAEAPGGRVCEARVDALACEVVEVLTLPADRALPERLAAWLEPFTWERTAAVVAEVLRSSTSRNTR